uniref:Uncharacterized protein n=1 Tax=Ananas comosus var. bracteatus TaxID=296719 RepID=A0A6V7NHH7_ANACO|nr:unnamed protein product [Ananas comosus var. bracteatus]
MATSSASSSTTSPTFVIANISNLVSIKLDRGNYLLWRQQFLPVLFAHDLMGYIDGSKECLSKFIKNADGTITDTVDSSFSEWMKQDRHLLSWIQATLTEGVLAQVVGLQTSRDVWVALERRYASLLRAHISQLTTQLQTIKKGGMTITDNMNKIKAISDNLAAVGKSIHDDDLIHHIVHGLPSEYDPIWVSIRINPSISTVEEVHAILASEELLLEERRQLQSSITHESTAFIAQNNSFQNNLGSNYGQGRNTNNGRGRGRGRGGYGRGGGQPPRKQQHKCKRWATSHLPDLQSNWPHCTRLSPSNGLCISRAYSSSAPSSNGGNNFSLADQTWTNNRGRRFSKAE